MEVYILNVSHISSYRPTKTIQIHLLCRPPRAVIVTPRTFRPRSLHAPRINTSHSTSQFTTSHFRTSQFTHALDGLACWSVSVVHILMTRAVGRHFLSCWRTPQIRIQNFGRKTVPPVDHTLAEEKFPYIQSWSDLCQFLLMSSDSIMILC